MLCDEVFYRHSTARGRYRAQRREYIWTDIGMTPYSLMQLAAAVSTTYVRPWTAFGAKRSLRSMLAILRIAKVRRSVITMMDLRSCRAGGKAARRLRAASVRCKARPHQTSGYRMPLGRGLLIRHWQASER